jgi:hypothetical protein
LMNRKWQLKEKLDMRNIPMPEDEGVTDPKAERQRSTGTRRQK